MASAKHVVQKLGERAVKPRLIEPDEWPVILGRLAAKLSPGADVIATPPEVIEAARAVAPEFGLSPGWMNARAEEAGYVDPSAAADTRVVMREGPLEVSVPSAGHMLAMKVARFAGATDVDDAKLLLSRLRHLASVGRLDPGRGLVPVAERAQAKHNLERLWEMVHGSA